MDEEKIQIVAFSTNDTDYKMYYINPKTGIMDNVYTPFLQPGESFGHAMEIVTKSDTGIYVVSWGKYFFIPYSALSSANYVVIRKVNIDVNEK